MSAGEISWMSLARLPDVVGGQLKLVRGGAGSLDDPREVDRTNRQALDRQRLRSWSAEDGLRSGQRLRGVTGPWGRREVRRETTGPERNGPGAWPKGLRSGGEGTSIADVDAHLRCQLGELGWVVATVVRSMHENRGARHGNGVGGGVRIHVTSPLPANVAWSLSPLRLPVTAPRRRSR